MATSSKAIAEAFLELLKSTPANKITVKQLSEAAGVTRSSFYNNYSDIPALAQKICEDYASHFMREYSGYESFPAAIRAASEMAVRNRRVLLNMFNFMDRDISESFLFRMAENVVRAYYEGVLRESGRPEWEIQIIITCVADCYFGYLVRWFIGGMRDDLVKAFEEMKSLMDVAMFRKTDR